MKRNGYTSAGRTRWRCKSPGCGASKTRRNDTGAAGLTRFLGWLFSKRTQAQVQGGTGRTFRHQVARFWEYWPLPHFHDHYADVLHIDGLHLRRKAVVLISSTTTMKVHGWYVARSEHSGAWMALMAQTPPPLMVVTDGGAGFRKAAKQFWPQVRIQRCLFHVHLRIQTKTTQNPRLAAGRELKQLSLDLLAVRTLEQADAWTQAFIDWETRWKTFLEEKTLYATGQYQDTHQRLVAARNMIRTLIRQGHLFTFLDPTLVEQARRDLPSTNNTLEGGINAPLRAMLKDHAGMPLTHRIKAIFWWCYHHSPSPLPPGRILKEMPTDQTIEALYQTARTHLPTNQPPGSSPPVKWGTAISWQDLHHKSWKR